MYIQSLTCAVAAALFNHVHAQMANPAAPEKNLPLSIETCTTTGCEKVPATITLDADMRPLLDLKGGKPCLNKAAWEPTACPDAKTCTRNCALSGVNYADFGVSTQSNSLTMTLFNSQGIGSRLYLLDGKDKYKMYKLLNQEFTFDVDLSKVPCGANAALYFSSMEEDGGKAKTEGAAGPDLGVGYCDAQGFSNNKFVKGLANFKPAAQGGGATTGKFGVPCPELDILEGNTVSQAFTPHPCKKPKLTVCEAETCHADGGFCDPSGCDFASYRLGATEFYGPSKTIDTSKKMTIVTQFITKDGADTGTLKEIRRLYVVDGKVIQNAPVNLPGIKPYDSITSDFCTTVQNKTMSSDSFNKNGGLVSMGKAMKKGMVLVFSLWFDEGPQHMSWLDGNPSKDPKTKGLGVIRGTCDSVSDTLENTRKKYPDVAVKFSNIRSGPIGSTFKAKSLVEKPSN